MLKLSSSKPSPCESEIIVRPARAQDAPFIRAMAQNTFLAFGSYDRYLADWFENDAVTTSIAELDERAAGFSMITAYADPERPRENVADLVAIAVVTELQSRGIGGQLLAKALALAESSPSKPREVWLVVAEDNPRAQRLFRSAGFRLGDGLGIYPAGQRALRMIKPFPQEAS